MTSKAFRIFPSNPKVCISVNDTTVDVPSESFVPSLSASCGFIQNLLRKYLDHEALCASFSTTFVIKSKFRLNVKIRGANYVNLFDSTNFPPKAPSNTHAKLCVNIDEFDPKASLFPTYFHFLVDGKPVVPGIFYDPACGIPPPAYCTQYFRQIVNAKYNDGDAYLVGLNTAVFLFPRIISQKLHGHTNMQLISHVFDLTAATSSR